MNIKKISELKTGDQVQIAKGLGQKPEWMTVSNVENLDYPMAKVVFTNGHERVDSLHKALYVK